MRPLRFITLHCSASDNPAHDNLKTIHEWHTANPPMGRGWSDTGYHFFIRKNGNVEFARPLERIPASAKGHNTGCIAICLSGLDQFTQQQFKSAAFLCKKYMDLYHIPVSSIYPHHHFNPDKSCPNFDIAKVTGLI